MSDSLPSFIVSHYTADTDDTSYVSPEDLHFTECTDCNYPLVFQPLLWLEFLKGILLQLPSATAAAVQLDTEKLSVFLMILMRLFLTLFVLIRTQSGIQKLFCENIQALTGEDAERAVFCGIFKGLVRKLKKKLLKRLKLLFTLYLQV